MTSSISIIAAVSENGVIGSKNALPWHLPDDLLFFKKQTWGKLLIMGRATFESIGKNLIGRDIIVISRDKSYKKEGISVVNNLEEALSSKINTQEILIAGGGQIYAQTINRADKMYLTLVHTKISEEPTYNITYFPKVDLNYWEEIHSIYHPKDSRHLYSFTFKEFKKKELKK
jgi:dihydrofolate reductase